MLFFLYLGCFHPQHVAALRGQTDRNIRKVRDVAIRKLRKRVYLSLKAQADRGYSHFIEQERHLLEEYYCESVLKALINHFIYVVLHNTFIFGGVGTRHGCLRRKGGKTNDESV
jgi:hypothetical protein